MNSNGKVLALMATLAACGACIPTTKQPSPMASLTPPVAEAPAPQYNPASLYSQASQPGFLYEDSRARRIGDILMVQITEKSNAKNTVKTHSNKDNEVNMSVGAYFGHSHIDPVPGSSQLNGVGIPLGSMLGMNGRTGTSPVVQASSNNQFTADTETERDSNVTAVVGCRVVNILPGGVMQVEGARQVRVNDDNQIMVVRGLVRPIDVGPDNSLPSSAMAECQIDIYGTGVLQDRQKPGWLSRILDNVWGF
jgi:flagellar L-ring protein precursor FlgH